jgi:hypothetical protein
LLATAGFDPLDETYAYQNNFVAKLWQVKIGEAIEGENASPSPSMKKNLNEGHTSP